jgi:DNA-binding MarR family transcriptional regulator
MESWKHRVADYIRDSPTPYIGERTIAAAIGTNRRVVRNALDTLEQEGVITREIRTDDKGFVLVSKFTINDDWEGGGEWKDVP